MRYGPSFWILGLSGALVFSGAARADIVFNFDSLNPLSRSSTIQSYMTDVFDNTVVGGTVRVTGAASVGGGIGIGRVFGRDFTVEFSEAISAVGFDGWVLWETGGADFRAVALDKTGAELETIYYRDHAGWTQFNVPRIGLGDGVYGLKFTDHGIADIGIDNLVISLAPISPDSALAVVPAPGAALLAVIGLGLVGWVKRRLV